MVTTCSHFCSLIIHDKAHQDYALKRTSWTSFKIYSDYETENVVGHVKPITLNYEEEGEEKGEETGEECNREEGLIKVRCLRVLYIYIYLTLTKCTTAKMKGFFYDSPPMTHSF